LKTQCSEWVFQRQERVKGKERWKRRGKVEQRQIIKHLFPVFNMLFARSHGDQTPSREQQEPNQWPSQLGCRPQFSRAHTVSPHNSGYTLTERPPFLLGICDGVLERWCHLCHSAIQRNRQRITGFCHRNPVREGSEIDLDARDVSRSLGEPIPQRAFRLESQPMRITLVSSSLHINDVVNIT